MLRCVRGLATAATMAVLPGCAYVDSVQSRYDNVNRNAAQARNESILLNIVRAGDNAPLNFVAFSRVTAVTSASGNLALPTFALGPDPAPVSLQRVATVGDRALGSSSNVQNSMDLTILDSHDFYSALLSPVDLPTLSYFVRQGYSRELLFRLFTDSVRARVGGKDYEFPNDPAQSCQPGSKIPTCFDDMVAIAVASGLTAETRIEQAPSTGKKKGAGTADAPRYITFGRLCFDPVLAARARREYSSDIFGKLLAAPGAHRPQCRSKSWPKQTVDGSSDTLTFDLPQTRLGPIHFEIITRSTFGIYQFLGRMLARGTIENMQMEPRLDVLEDRRLLTLNAGAPGGCFAETSYRGVHYCVPEDGAEQTKRIFSLLAQLLALKTQSGDLAITPTVRVTQ